MRATNIAATLLIAAVAGAQQQQGPATRFDIRTFHSQVEFSVPFMGLSRVKGAFEDFEGTLSFNAARPESSIVILEIATPSIHTGNEMRDRHLRSADFFDVERYPTMRFESTRIATRSPDSYDVTGNLTLHGVTRSIVVPVRVRHGLVSNANGLDYVGFDVAMRLNWRDFGIAASNQHNGWFQPATMLVSDSVDVAVNIEAERRRRRN